MCPVQTDDHQSGARGGRHIGSASLPFDAGTEVEVLEWCWRVFGKSKRGNRLSASAITLSQRTQHPNLNDLNAQTISTNRISSKV